MIFNYADEYGEALDVLQEETYNMEQILTAMSCCGEDLLGYITRYKNETIARLMDAGKKFIAVVDEFPDAKEQVKRKWAPTESGIVISVYLVED